LLAGAWRSGTRRIGGPPRRPSAAAALHPIRRPISRG